MKPRKLTATAPDGTTATRKTSRSYTHVVFAKLDLGWAVARNREHSNAAHSIWETHRRNWRYHRDVASGAHEHGQLDPGIPEWKLQTRERNIEEARVLLERHPAVADYIDHLIGLECRALDADIAAGKFRTWECQGWCSRRDLAEKLASKTRHPRWAQVVIRPVDEA